MICDCSIWVAQTIHGRCEQTDSCCIYKEKRLFWTLAFIFEASRILGLQQVRSWDQAGACRYDIICLKGDSFIQVCLELVHPKNNAKKGFTRRCTSSCSLNSGTCTGSCSDNTSHFFKKLHFCMCALSQTSV